MKLFTASVNVFRVRSNHALGHRVAPHISYLRHNGVSIPPPPPGRNDTVHSFLFLFDF